MARTKSVWHFSTQQYRSALIVCQLFAAHLCCSTNLICRRANEYTNQLLVDRVGLLSYGLICTFYLNGLQTIDKMNFLAFFIITFGTIYLTMASKNESLDQLNEMKVLSRRKRFIIFPEGSSFQMVFCAQNQGYLQVGDIVWFGNTAALAWELPTDPIIFYQLKDHDKLHEAQNRDGVSKHIYLLDETGKVLSKIPYRKRPIVNPAFAKRSIDYLPQRSPDKISIKKMHEKHTKRDYFHNLSKSELDFHREGRKSIYMKIEKFMEALGWRGPHCVLRMLCENGKGTTKQGTFLEEIMRATFSLSPGREFEASDHKQYDFAYSKKKDCDLSYPDCEYFDGSVVPTEK